MKMRKVKKIRFTHVAFAVTFAIGISVFSTPAVAQNDIRATVPVHLRNVHPDVVECYMSVAVGHYGPGEGAESEWYARAVTQLDYDPSGNGSFDGDVVVTIDLRQVYIGNDPRGEQPSGRNSDYAYEDLKAENFDHYYVRFSVVHSNGEGRNMNDSPNTPAWAKCEERMERIQEIVKDPSGGTKLYR